MLPKQSEHLARCVGKLRIRFLNSTCGLDGQPCHGEDPITTDSPSAIDTPDVALEGVARYQERFFSQRVFFEQAGGAAIYTGTITPLYQQTQKSMVMATVAKQFNILLLVVTPRSHRVALLHE